MSGFVHADGDWTRSDKKQKAGRVTGHPSILAGRLRPGNGKGFTIGRKEEKGKSMRKTFLFLAIVGLAVALITCMPQIGGKSSTGSLAVNVGNSIKAQQIEPPGGPTTMIVATYDVQILNSASAVVVNDPGVSGGKTYPGLPVDTYTVYAVGKNGAGLAIGDGTSDPVPVAGGQTANASVTVKEFSGFGQLSVTANWTAGVVSSPRIVSTMGYGNSTPASITWTLGTNTASYSNDSLANGWYSLVFQLFDDGASSPSAGFATLARVVKNLTTTGHIDMVPNVTTGGMLVDIVWQGFDEIALGTNVAAGTIKVYDATAPQTITVSGASFYLWYVDGTAVNTLSTPSYTVSPSNFMENTTHRIDCLGFNPANGTAGQLTWTVLRSVADYSQIVEGTVTNNAGLGIVVTLHGQDVNDISMSLPASAGPAYAFMFSNVPPVTTNLTTLQPAQETMFIGTPPVRETSTRPLATSSPSRQPLAQSSVTGTRPGLPISAPAPPPRWKRAGAFFCPGRMDTATLPKVSPCPAMRKVSAYFCLGGR